MTANQVQIRRDSATNLDAATPASGELGYDTTNKRLRLGDGTTAGGIRVPNSLDIQGQTFTAAAASGTDTITMTVAPAPAAYATYQRFVFKAAADNTGSATLNVNSLGAKTIKKKTTSGLSDLAAGDIQQDAIYAVVYDGTYMQLESEIPPAATSQDLVYLGSATASASASLDFESLLDSANYGSYVFVLRGVTCATAGADFTIRTSTNNGSSYDSGSGNYEYAGMYIDYNDTSPTTNGAASATSIIPVSHVNVTDLSGVIELVNPHSSLANKYFVWNLISDNAGAISFIGGGSRASTTSINAVRFIASTGNIGSGVIDLYGRKNV